MGLMVPALHFTFFEMVSAKLQPPKKVCRFNQGYLTTDSAFYLEIVIV
jgi:hypothetical protein